MTCRELLGKFTEALERDEVDWVLLNKLVKKCGLSFALEAGRAFAKKVVQAVASRAWALYRGAVTAGKDPAIAYGQAVEMIWRLWDWFSIQCGPSPTSPLIWPRPCPSTKASQVAVSRAPGRRGRREGM